MNIPCRRSARLKGYDYAQPAAYFVTVCTRDRECLLSHVVNGEMRLNDAGEIVQSVWDGLPDRFPATELDAFVVMPNHVHGIVAFVGAGLALPAAKGAASSAPTLRNVGDGATRGARALGEVGNGVAGGTPTLADLVRAFKPLSAIHVNRRLMRSGSLWQRSYYEHVIRNERELDKIREYIITNPLRWALDRENPQRTE
jgi:REP element-mobilizing transposase RayT